MQKGLVWGAIAALGFSAPTFAEEGFSYSFLDLGYLSTALDDSDVEGDGFGISGSVELNDRVHLIASYGNQDFDFDRIFGQDFTLKGKSYEFGAGINSALSPRLDIEAHLSYLRAEVDTPFGGNVDDNGVGVGLDLRGRLGDRWELQGGATYADFDDGGDSKSLHFGARFFITPQFAVTGDISGNEDGSTLFLGGRFNFGR
jgi:hypothetical protein